MTETEKPTAQSTLGPRFRVGEWLVEPDQGELRRGGKSVRIEPKAMEVLVYLAGRPGQVVTREDLERDVWRGALVGYDAVTSTLIKLRKALGDSARKPSMIRTIPKRGYQLIAPVGPADDYPGGRDGPEEPEKAAGSSFRSRKSLWWIVGVVFTLVLLVIAANTLFQQPAEAPQPNIVVPRTLDIPTLVVFPFADLSQNVEQRYLTAGVTEDVIANLSRLSGLRVIARNSAFSFGEIDIDPREAAAQLGVRYVLQGSVRSAGEQLRIIAKLIDTESGTHLWAKQFDGEKQEIFALQDRVAEQTATALAVELTEEEKRGLRVQPTTNSGAYEFYLRGRVIPGSLSERESDLARRMYRRAIEEDPNFALAYAGLAFTYIDDFRNSRGRDSEQYAAEAAKLAQQAVALDRELPQAHFAVGFVALYGRAEHERAIEAAKQALALDPNYADAYALLSSAYFFSGNLDKTLELDREAMRLNPASSFVYDNHIGRRYYLEGRYQDALDYFKVAAAKNYNFVPTHVWLAATYAKLGDLDEAEWAADQIRTLEPDFSIAEWMRRRPYKNPEHRDHLVMGLRLAGLE